MVLASAFYFIALHNKANMAKPFDCLCVPDILHAFSQQLCVEDIIFILQVKKL